MRIVVMSDSHGRVDRVKQVIEQQSEAELFIFLGDGTKDFHQAMRGVPKEDWCGSLYPTYAVIDIQGKNIVCNHIRLEEQH